MQVAIEQAVIIRSKTKAFYKGEAHHTHTHAHSSRHTHTVNYVWRWQNVLDLHIIHCWMCLQHVKIKPMLTLLLLLNVCVPSFDRMHSILCWHKVIYAKRKGEKDWEHTQKWAKRQNFIIFSKCGTGYMAHNHYEFNYFSSSNIRFMILLQKCIAINNNNDIDDDIVHITYQYESDMEHNKFINKYTFLGPISFKWEW